RISEGASMLCTKHETGTGNIVEAVRHMRQYTDQIGQVASLREYKLMTYAKNSGASYEGLLEI
ncbi:pyridoxal 5'-phosphate synthase lyase subunit PdxS, partial [Bacillus cereus]|nr:pyridoxal 5'-phosphate synthase lyase subunit PdxS [Bacillus cereus]